MISYLYAALIAVGTLVIGILLGIWIRKRAAKRAEEKISNADEEALRIVNEAIKSAENKKREVMLEAKEDILRSRNEYEKEVKERRAEQQKHAQCDDPSLFHSLFLRLFRPPASPAAISHSIPYRARDAIPTFDFFRLFFDLPLGKRIALHRSEDFCLEVGILRL